MTESADVEDFWGGDLPWPAIAVTFLVATAVAALVLIRKRKTDAKKTKPPPLLSIGHELTLTRDKPSQPWPLQLSESMVLKEGDERFVGKKLTHVNNKEVTSATAVDLTTQGQYVGVFRFATPTIAPIQPPAKPSPKGTLSPLALQDTVFNTISVSTFDHSMSSCDERSRPAEDAASPPPANLQIHDAAARLPQKPPPDSSLAHAEMQIRELRMELAAAKEENAALQAVAKKFEAMAQEVESRESADQAVKDVLDRHNSNLAEARAAKTAAEQDVSRLQGELAAMRQQLEATAAQLEEARRSAANSDKVALELQLEVASREEALAHQGDAIDDMARHIAALEERAQAAEQDPSDQQQHTMELEAKLQDAVREAEAARREAEDLAAELGRQRREDQQEASESQKADELEGKLSEARELQALAEERARRAEEAVAMLQEECRQATSDATRAVGELEEARKRLAMAEERLKVLERDEERRTAEATVPAERLEEEERRRRKAEERIQELEEELHATREADNAVSAALKSACSSSNDELVMSLQQQLKDATATLSDKEAALDEKSQRIEALEEEVAWTEKRLRDTTEGCAKLEEEVARMVEKETETVTQQAESMKTIASLEGKLVIAEEALREREADSAELAESRETIQRLKRRVDELEKGRSSYRHGGEEDADELRRKILYLEAELDRFQRMVAELQAEAAAKEETIEAAVSQPPALSPGRDLNRVPSSPRQERAEEDLEDKVWAEGTEVFASAKSIPANPVSIPPAPSNPPSYSSTVSVPPPPGSSLPRSEKTPDPVRQLHYESSRDAAHHPNGTTPLLPAVHSPTNASSARMGSPDQSGQLEVISGGGFQSREVSVSPTFHDFSNNPSGAQRGNGPSPIEKLRRTHGLTYTLTSPGQNTRSSTPPSFRGRVPNQLMVISSEKAVISGKYERLQEEFNGMPMWGSGSRRIFSSREGYWMVSADEKGPSSNVGRLVSGRVHEGLLPHEVESWKHSDGMNWVTSSSRIIQVARGDKDVPQGRSGSCSSTASSGDTASYSPPFGCEQPRPPPAVPSVVPKLQLPDKAVKDSEIRAQAFGLPAGWRMEDSHPPHNLYTMIAPDGKEFRALTAALAHAKELENRSGSPSRHSPPPPSLPSRRETPTDHHQAPVFASANGRSSSGYDMAPRSSSGYGMAPRSASASSHEGRHNLISPSIL